MKKSAKLLCLVLVLAVLGGAYFLLTRQTAQEETSSDSSDESISVYLVEAEDIVRLSWTVDGETCTLEKLDDVWSCDEDYPLDESMIEILVDTACAVVAERTVSLGEDGLAEFELDDPAMTVTVATDSTETTFLLGLRNPYTDQNYAMLEGQDTVYLLETDLYSTFDLSLLDLIQMEALDDYETTRTLTITQDGSSFVMLHPEDNEGLGYSDDFTWFAQGEDGDTIALDATNAASLAATITGLNWEACVAYAPEDLSEYGLDEPLVTVTIDYEQSEGGSETAVLLIGDVAEYEEIEESSDETDEDDSYDTAAANEDLANLLDELGLPEDDGDAAGDHTHDEAAEETQSNEPEPLSYYAMLEGSNLVYRLDAGTVQDILDANLESLLPEDICLIDWDTLTAMTFTIDGEEYQFLIRRLEDENEDGNLTTTVVCSYNGEEVDEADVEAVLDAITGLKQEATASSDTEAASDGSEITIRFSRDRDTYSIMTMTLRPYDLNFYVVEFDGRADQLVSIRDVAELSDMVVNFGASAEEESAD